MTTKLSWQLIFPNITIDDTEGSAQFASVVITERTVTGTSIRYRWR
ncbi:hypothetical protein O9993_21485 [Vibrio lentus]|nr:hypothetical protein [Vibrio lentus]